MNHDSHPQDQQRLESLLRWKKHEQPPPGFFSTFSNAVVAEIQSPSDPPSSFFSSWWQQFAGPALACSFGLVVGSVLFFGLAASHSATDSTEFSYSGREGNLKENTPGRIPNLESKEYPMLFGATDLSSMRPVIRSGPEGFLLERNPDFMARASLRLK